VNHPAIQWIIAERSALIDQLAPGFQALQIALFTERGQVIQEEVITLCTPGQLDASIGATLSGMTKAAGWSLRGVFPSRTGTRRLKETASSTAGAVRTILRWTRWWLTVSGVDPSAVFTVEELRRSAQSDVVVRTQSIAQRICDLLKERRGLAATNTQDLLRRLEGLGSTHAVPQDVTNLVVVVQRLLSQAKIK